jgi:hypothetical protein
METTHHLDHERRRVTLVIGGPFDFEQLHALVMSRPHDETWGYGVLFDMRGMTGVPTVQQLRELGATVRDSAQAKRGPLAILVTDAGQYNMACAYAAMVTRYRAVQVFHDRSEADAWLTMQLR